MGGREQKQQQKKEHNIIKLSDYILSYNFDIEINMLSICLPKLFCAEFSVCLFDHF